jgi:outer membrane receptor protein involved in Fe transport
MVGGGWQDNQFNSAQSLKAEEQRNGLFTRLSFDLTENTTAFLQASRNKTETTNITGYQFNQANVVIRSDNAFIPASVRTALQANNIASFTMGTMNADLPLRLAANERTVQRFVAGLDGKVNLFGSDWRWNAYYQQGKSDSIETAKDITNNARLALAQDAVFRPGTTQIVCRSTLTDPNNGCVPLNRMGVGVVSKEALAYVLGNPQREQTLEQRVAAISINGEPFSVAAGPVSLATGIEWREEEVTGFVDPIYRSGWFVGNYLPNFGKYDVKEAFVETVVPLAAGKPMAEALDLNAAVRRTDYSTSGAVTTWKVGLTYSPNDDLRFRLTRSRDIRAPNLGELFAAGTSNTNNVLDPFNSNANTQYRGVNRGNPNLLPEEADQWGFGVVLQPGALPGFNASVDYYEIDLAGAIGSLPAQEIVDRCFEGNQVYCAAITRGVAAGGTNIITEIAISPFNLAERINRGVDLELSYQMDVPGLSGNDGNLQLRGLVTHYLENYSDDGIVKPTDSVGSNSGDGPPDYMYRLTARYKSGPYSMTVTGRGISSGVYNTAWVE